MGQVVEHRYRIIRRIGEGAMATVYEVMHTGLHSRHAIKVLDASLAQDPDLRQRFLAEGQIQAQLRHPHIVTVTDIVTDPVAGLVMEYVEGPTLDEFLAERGAPDLDGILSLMLPILDGVAIAHDGGIVHRDLKPENIIIGRGRSGRVHPKVTDFGIAKVVQSSKIRTGKQKTKVATRMGTLAYMSPEQVTGQSEVDTRSDIFSLGAILYEVVTGKLAFDADTEFETMRSIVDGTFEPPERVVGDLNPVIGACIRKALAIDPAERFSDCRSFQSVLENANTPGAPVPEKPSRSAAITRPPPSKTRKSAATRPAQPKRAAKPRTAPQPPVAARARDSHEDPWYRPGMLKRDPGAQPVAAALLNLMCPCQCGLGQIVNGQVAKGFFLFFLHSVLGWITGGLTFPITWGIAVVDAYVVGAKRKRRAIGKWQWF